MSRIASTNNVINKEISLNQQVNCATTESKLNHKENLNMELKREYEQLLLREKHLDKELAMLKDVNVKPEAKSSIMEQLHVYNDVKDVTQIVLGSLARLEDVTVTELHERFGLSYKDNDA